MKKSSQNLEERKNNVSKISDSKRLYLGVDISTNHGALALIDENGLIDFRAIAQVKSLSKHYPDKFRDSFKDKEGGYIEKYGFNCARLINHTNDYRWFIHELISEQEDVKKLYCLIEGYAYNAQGNTFEIAEMTACFKKALYDYCNVWDIDLEFLFPSPKTVKKFYTGNGNADKNQMIKVTEDMYVNFKKYTSSIKTTETLEDLCDAYALACFGFKKDCWEAGHSDKFFDDLKKNGKIESLK